MPRRSRDLYVAASSEETNRIINDFLHSLIYRLGGDGVLTNEAFFCERVPCSGTTVKQDVAYFFSFFLFGGDRALVFLARTHVTRPTWQRVWLCRRACAGFPTVASTFESWLSLQMVHTASAGPVAVLIPGIQFLAALSRMILVITSWCKVSHPRLWCTICSASRANTVHRWLQNPPSNKALLYLWVPVVPWWDASGEIMIGAVG